MIITAIAFSLLSLHCSSTVVIIIVAAVIVIPLFVTILNMFLWLSVYTAFRDIGVRAGGLHPLRIVPYPLPATQHCFALADVCATAHSTTHRA